jgi:uncharacterized damage-inducible protein DinB
MKDYFVEQADYQRWASIELFRCLDMLTGEQRRAELGLFFHDIHKTADHILMVTRNWRARLDGHFDRIRTYDVLLYPDWDHLKTATLSEFAQLGAWLSAQDDAWFARSVEYPGSSGRMRGIAVRDALVHIMTHAVHHRGQLSAACTRLGASAPEMDFVFYRWRRP